MIPPDLPPGADDPIGGDPTVDAGDATLFDAGPHATGRAELPARAGRYTILRELGRGGMGVVYLAEDPSLGRRVALKRLPTPVAGDETRMERFRAEARLLASLNHPNIATIHSLEEADGVPFLTMEAVEGITLAGRLSEGPLSLADAIETGRQIARAVEAAHRKGIVHRDLKPGNVMVTGEGVVKVLDFGLAAPAAALASGESEDPASGEISGTPGYMSPEQLRGAPSHPAMDAWAFGCILYECLTGRRAIVGESSTERMHNTASPSISPDQLEDVPAPLAELVVRCLEVDPSSRTSDLTEVRRTLETLVAEGSIHHARAPRADAEGGRRHNLPTHASSFVGRAREVGEITDLLAEHRLVTLTGMGGVGKTRLSLRVAEEVITATEVEARFVELAPLVRADEVAPTLQAVLRVPESLDRTALDAVCEHLARRRMLLVIDNCEHVLDGVVEAVTAILRTAPEVRILTSSREHLAVDGEWRYAVPRLEPPATDQALDPGAARESAAVQLFVQRARRANPAFTLDASTVGAVTEICRKLDGIPLAIELAASRLRMLAVNEILCRLDDRFRLLGGGSRDGLPHHRTLRALIDWSHDHLDEDERALFRRLSVFAGGWSLEAAEEVAAGGVVADWDVLDLMARLVDKSLVEADVAAGQGRSRFRMLETVKAYAAERLAESGEAEDLRGRHADYFAGLAARAEPHFVGEDQTRWIGRLADEHDELRRAFETLTRDGVDPERALAMVASLFRFWLIRGHWSEAYEFGRIALARGEGREPGASTASVHNAVASVAYFNGRLDEARDHYERARAMWTTLGREVGMAACALNLGNIDYATGEFEKAEACFSEARAIYVRNDQADGLCRALLNLGNVALVTGRYEDARGFGLEVIDRLEKSGHAELIAQAHTLVGTAELRLDDLDAARRRYEATLEIQRELGDRRSTAIATINLGAVWTQLGRFDEGRRAYVDALRGFHELHEPGSIAAAMEGMAVIAWKLGRDQEAGRLYGVADGIREALGQPRVPDEEEVTTTIRAGITDRIGADVLAAAMADGRTMELDAAVAWVIDAFGGES